MCPGLQKLDVSFQYDDPVELEDSTGFVFSETRERNAADAQTGYVSGIYTNHDTHLDYFACDGLS